MKFLAFLILFLACYGVFAIASKFVRFVKRCLYIKKLKRGEADSSDLKQLLGDVLNEYSNVRK